MSVRRSDPESSHEAASLRRGFPWRVLLAACQWGEFTDDLLVERTGGERNVVARRRLDLERKQLIERIVDPRDRPIYAVGRSETKVLTFRVTDRGKTLMADELKRRGLIP